MFKTKINTTALHNVVKAMAAVIDESIFVVSPDGMESRAVDASNASLCEISIPKDVFIEYSITECEFGIDLNRFVEIISMADKNGEVEMALNPDTHKLDISMSGLSYTLSLLDPSTMRKVPQVPELNLPSQIVLPTSKFKQGVKASGMVSDSTTIGVKDNTFYIESKGDSDCIRVDIPESELISIVSAEVSGTYSLDYLSDFSKGIGTTQEITISIGRDLPLLIDFSPYERCDVTYLLAPRIDPM